MLECHCQYFLLLSNTFFPWLLGDHNLPDTLLDLFCWPSPPFTWQLTVGRSRTQSGLFSNFTLLQISSPSPTATNTPYLINYPVSIYPALTPPGAQVSFRYFKFNVTKTDAIFSSSTPNLLLLQVAHAKTSGIILYSFFSLIPHI